MSLTKETVRKIGDLARLNLSADDLTQYVPELSRILNFIEQMGQIDTTNVLPLAHPLDVVQRLRPDHVSELDQRETFQSLAPLVESGLYLVPQVIEDA